MQGVVSGVSNCGDKQETVYSTRRRGDAEKKKQSQDLRAQRKRRLLVSGSCEEIGRAGGTACPTTAQGAVNGASRLRAGRGSAANLRAGGGRGLGRRGVCRWSGRGRNSWFRWKRSGCAGWGRRSGGREGHSGRGRPCPRGRR